jgi:hypothetical protein
VGIGIAVGLPVGAVEAGGDAEGEADAGAEAEALGTAAPDVMAQLRPVTVHDDGICDDPLTG